MSGSDPKESFASLFESSQGSGKRPKRPRRGDRLDVRVVAIGKDAVFVDLGEKQEGFLERSELAAKDGTLSVEVGSTISAVVVDSDGETVRLQPVFVRAPQSERVIEQDGASFAIPVARNGPLLVEGAHIRGTITGVERYGLFVQIEGTQGRHGRGLVPTAETATPRGADLRKQFPVGSPVEAKILQIGEDGKIRLSIKALGEDVERSDFEAYSKQSAGTEAPATTEPAAGGRPDAKAKPKPAPRGFGTLGDLLSKGGSKK
jgi:small subunit ribosomal protein S1